jgi:hypothetical protein
MTMIRPTRVVTAARPVMAGRPHVLWLGTAFSLVTVATVLAGSLGAQPAGVRDAQAAVRAANEAVLRGGAGIGNGRVDPRDNRRRDNRVLFTWNGTVDREAIITMRGRDITVRGDRNAGRNSQPRASGALPRTDGDVWVRVQDGRGQVQVIQQPTSRNNWTTRIRIRDTRGGTDRYRITAYWAPDDRGGWGRPDRRDDDWGWDDPWGRNGDWGRDRGRDGDWGRGGVTSGLRWSGIVDDLVELRIRGRTVDVIERSGARTQQVRSQFGPQGLPRQDAVVRLQQVNGRGTVSVVQQPALWNSYTAVVRIRDPRGGADRYDLTLVW